MSSLLKNGNFNRIPPNRKLVGGLFILTGILSLVFWLKGREKNWEPIKFTYTVENPKTNSTRDVTRSTAQFVAQIEQILNSSTGTYAVYVYRLTENRGYGINEQEIMPAASIIKVPIMAAVFKAVQRGDLTLDQTYTLQAADKRGGSGPLEYMKSGTQLTVQKMMEVMGKNSDNSAPVILSRLVGRDEVEKTMADLGMINTDFLKNTTTAADIVSVWKTLYQEHYLTDEHLELMWSFLQDSIYEERIPAGLPEDINLVHKVGTDADIWADAGIILTDDPFVLVIMNKEARMDEAKKLVVELTKKVWEYESARPAK
jgi:beta-lactamase class A